MESQTEENLIVEQKHSCMNCGYSFEGKENFCPNCGQANDTKRVLFKDLIIDILGYFFFYDYKVKNSLKLMLLKPGQLSISFIQGKKVDLIHPIRLYFIVSLIFFALESINSNNIENSYDYTVQTDTIREPDTGLYAFFGVTDSSIIDSNLIEYSKINKLNLLKLFIIERKNNKGISKEDIFKKYKIEKTSLNNFIFSKAEYSIEASIEDLGIIIGKKFKLLIFIFLPFFVIFMYLIHYKRDIYYYENLVFAFNTQTALFLLLIVGEIITFFSVDIGTYTILFIFTIAFPLYLYIALKRFYQYQSHKRAILVFILINTTFFILSILFFIISFITLYLIS